MILVRDVPDLEKLSARKLWADFSFPNEKYTKNATAPGSAVFLTPPFSLSVHRYPAFFA